MKTPISDAAVYEVLGTDKVVDYEVCRDLELKLENAKHLLKFALGVLNKFDYEPSDADEPSSLFSGYESEDWFYSVKGGIEDFLS